MNNISIYNQFVDAQRAGKDGAVTTYGIQLLAKETENPFASNTEEHELFFQAQKYFRKWQSQGIDNRFSRKQMVEYLHKLAAVVAKPAAEAPAAEPKPYNTDKRYALNVVGEPAIEPEVVDKIVEAPLENPAFVEEIEEAIRKISVDTDDLKPDAAVDKKPEFSNAQKKNYFKHHKE